MHTETDATVFLRLDQETRCAAKVVTGRLMVEHKLDGDLITLQEDMEILQRH